MRAGVRAAVVAGFATLALAGCGGGGDGTTTDLMNIRSNSGTPDEFAILPAKPLQLPENIAELPPPTPGGSNITDPTPEADAVAALGGNPARTVVTGRATSDGGLVGYASRYGVAPDIRTVLAAEDLEWRQRNKGRPLERLFNINVYYKAYRPMSLDQQAELAKWRARGVRNVQAPPDPALYPDQ